MASLKMEKCNSFKKLMYYGFTLISKRQPCVKALF